MCLEVYERLHPDHPWLTKSANEILMRVLQPDFTGLEFGSGRSTLWLARRVGHLTSIEHDRAWHDKVSTMLNREHVNNVTYMLHEPACGEVEADTSHYVRVLDSISPNSLDFVLVDGIFRSACANGAIDKLRPAGFLIVDNINWYLPSDSHAPNSRTIRQGPASREWADFSDRVAGWRCDWTTSGVTDTAIFHKP